ncbi:hypothetical protein BD289DRAFT_134423 [Coniella lustricola]|uniref:Uncharacterized protein n=1 Tax=Coniella lustricola TaxID=2025994 RepID=A0A2T2ZVN8_9PEZI|nr:hypothetical protein BD289DRAFT_134423 [Coniella lustricola]
MHIWALSLLTAVSCIAGTASTASNEPGVLPDIQASREHAYAFFNSIHSAIRQWGSSYHHNGLSFYVAQAPTGSVFYHGAQTPERPPGFEWLGFEIEHSASFAMSFEPLPKDMSSETAQGEMASMDNRRREALLWHLVSHGRSTKRVSVVPEENTELSPPSQRPMRDTAFETAKLKFCDGKDNDLFIVPDFDKFERGYFHTYRANRPLNLLYIDGQSAAKSGIGTLDSQDHILLGWDTRMCHDRLTDNRRELERAQGFCDLAQEWALDADGNVTKIDGFIRMEAGFEIIYCDFSSKGGLDQVSVQASPFRNETGIDDETDVFYETRYILHMQSEWLRAAATRFHGLPAGRLDVDWSSMVSALAYPMNTSNPNADRSDLPRLVNSTKQDLEIVHDRLRAVLAARGGKSVREKNITNWQSVTDKIVSRYSSRLWTLATTVMDSGDFLAIIDTLIDPFTSYLELQDYSLVTAGNSTIDRCIQHYLETEPVNQASWTPEDEAIAAVMETVSQRICKTLFAARDVLRSGDTPVSIHTRTPLEEAQSGIQRLVKDLRWSTWKECGSCPHGTICSIPMFPSGSPQDYLQPTCQKPEKLLLHRDYWD